MILVLLLLIFVCLVMIGGGGYYMYKNKKSSDSETPGSTLTITEDGASVTENYRMMPKREKYIQMPEVAKCQHGAESEMCNAYDKNDGFAFVYDLSLADASGPRYESCPGGGHDCWYTEKYDEEGTLIAVNDKNGVSMLDKIADDIWSDKWNMESQIVGELASSVDFKDGYLVAKRTLRLGGGAQVETGDKVKPTHMPGSLYFVALFASMKSAGEEKPTKIIVKVKGAKDYFEKLVEGSRVTPGGKAMQVQT